MTKKINCTKCKHSSKPDEDGFVSCDALLPYWVADFLDINSIYSCNETASWEINGANPEYGCSAFEENEGAQCKT